MTSEPVEAGAGTAAEAGAGGAADDYQLRRAEHAALGRAWLAGLPPDTHLSHWTAGAGLGLPTYTLPGQLIATRLRGRPVRTDTHCVLVAQLRDGLDCIERNGMRLTSPARTVVDLARRWGFRESLPTADAALRAGMCTRSELEAMLRFQHNWPRIPRAMKVVRWASPLSESVLESYVRARIIELGLPVPAQQRDLGNESSHLGRVDFYWEEFRLVGETDGKLKYVGNPFAAWAEKLRQDSMADAGFSFIRWTWATAHERDELFAGRLLAAMHRAAIQAGVTDAIERVGVDALTSQTGLRLRDAAAALALHRL